jgi:uncharacterized protein
MELWFPYLTAFLAGLLGGVHCVGMCGGIVGAITFGLPREAQSDGLRLFAFHALYNLGRIFSYTLAGALMGGLGALLIQWMPLQQAQQGLLLVAGAFMILLGLYLGGWWKILGRVERLGERVWRRLEPLGRRLLPVRTPGQALGVGALWGWLPCGLVYTMLINAGLGQGSGPPLLGKWAGIAGAWSPKATPLDRPPKAAVKRRSLFTPAQGIMAGTMTKAHTWRDRRPPSWRGTGMPFL